MIKNVGWSYQTVSWRVPSKDVQNDVQTFFEKYHDYMSKGYHMVSLDETGFVSTKYQRRGYGIRGKRLRVSKQFEKRQKVTSIVAITSSGLMVHHSFFGNANGRSFMEFVDELFPILERNSVIILDNIAFHKSAYVKEKAESQGVELMFIPPYSPECNPIENFFAVCKNLVRKRQTFVESKDDNLLETVDGMMLELQEKHDFCSYWGKRERETSSDVLYI